MSQIQTLELDKDGHLLNHKLWTPDIAQQMAQSLDLELTEWHFEILTALQNFYNEYGYAPSTRPLIKYLIKFVSPDISNPLLMQRFKTGLVARHLTRLAGLPKPPNCL